MGVVRREGDWRLEKEGDGVYEITHEGQVQDRILTAEYSPEMMDSYGMGAIPIQEVDSFEEAVGLFEERTHGNPPSGILSNVSPTESSSTDRGGFDLGGSSDGELDDLPLGVVGIVFVLVGSLVLYSNGLQFGSTLFLVGLVFLGVGVLVIGGIAWMSDDIAEATSYFREAPEESTPASENTADRTPPAPAKLKRELKFERADNHCEWCGEFTNSPEVHHIEPRSEGGANKASNLIVLCPNHHRSADKGGISKTQLRQKVRHERS